jgi:hypothetical protein
MSSACDVCDSGVGGLQRLGDGLDVVAVGVEQERGVVAGVVLGPLAGVPVARLAGLACRRGRTPARRRRRVRGTRDGRARSASRSRARTSRSRPPPACGRARGGESRTPARQRRSRRSASRPPHRRPAATRGRSSRSAGGRVVYGFGAVAVGIEQEGAVVVVPVLGPRAGRSIVAVAGLDARPVEGVDVLAAGRHEPDVQPLGRGPALLGGRDREVVPLDQVVGAVARLDPERREDGRVEPLGCRAVRDADRHVVEHF